MAGRLRGRVHTGYREAARRSRLVGGSVLAVALLAAVLYFSDPGAVGGQLSGARPLPVVLAAVATVVSVGAWALAAGLLYRSAGGVPTRRFYLVYLFVGLFRHLLPSGYVAGPPLTALALSREPDHRFDPAMAALSVAELLSVVTSMLVLGAGAVVLAVSMPGGTGGAVGGGLVVAVLAILAGGLVLGLARDPWIAAAAVGFARGFERTVERLPLASRVAILSDGRLSARVEDLLSDVADVAGDRSTLLVAFGVTAAGWLAAVAPLYLCLLALDATVPVAVVLFAVPAAGLAAIVPTPGGVGSTEAVLIGVLVGLAGLSADVAAAGTVLFRLCTLGIELSVAAAAGGLLAASGRRPFPVE